MPLHLEEFQREEFQGYVETVPPKRVYALSKFFPVKQVFDTEFAYNVINGSYGQMASITGWDSGAPLRDKDVLARMTGELGKVQHGYRLTEKELLMFNRPRMEQEKKQAIQSVYDNTDKLVHGVHDREEWLRARAVYNGAISYTENDVKIDVDFKNSVANSTVTKAWITDVTADILGDLKTNVQLFRDRNNGELPAEMHISSGIETAFMKNSQLKTMIYGNSTDGRIITKDQVQGLFNSLDIPPYVVINESVRNETATAEKLMPDNLVVLIGADLGHTLIGPTVENNYEPGVYVIPVIQETNPPKQEVYVGETVFPALERSSAVLRITV
jgi:hypothetical protein